MGVKVDLTGTVIGKLTVLGYAGKAPSRESLWTVQCGCGSEPRTAYHGNLRSGKTTTCGCGVLEAARDRMTNRNPFASHGMTRTKAFATWCHVKSRCLNPNATGYEHYGGRGITVCDRWLESFENFYNDMGDPPSPTHSIDRIDNDGNYEPGNCRWATTSEQNANRRHRA